MRYRLAVPLQFILGCFGIYGTGRFLVGHWARGFGELLWGIAVILFLSRMALMYLWGREIAMYIVVLIQIATSIYFARALAKDLK